MELAPPIPGIAEATSSDHAQCGRLACMAAMRPLGDNDDLAAPDNATAGQLVEAIATEEHQLRATAVYRDILQVVTAGIGAGMYPIVGVYCDANANPVNHATGINHWITVYSTDGKYMNSWENTFGVVDLEACHNPQMGTVLIGKLPIALEANAMPVFLRWNGTQHIVWVNAQGTLRHIWYAGTSWGAEDITNDLPALAAVNGVVDPSTGTHISVVRGDGALIHCYQPTNGSKWAVEVHQ